MNNDIIFGRTWSDIQSMQQKKWKAPTIVIKNDGGDYGSDPIGDGKFRMVPSGDIVDYAERCRRLKRV